MPDSVAEFSLDFVRRALHANIAYASALVISCAFAHLSNRSDMGGFDVTLTRPLSESSIVISTFAI